MVLDALVIGRNVKKCQQAHRGRLRLPRALIACRRIARGVELRSAEKQLVARIHLLCGKVGHTTRVHKCPQVGTRYLRYLLDLFPGRLDLALAAYNAGEGAVQRAGNRIPAYKETQNYVRTVLGLYAQLKPPAPVLAQRAGPGRVRMELSGGALNRGNLPATRVAPPQNVTEPNPNE